MYNIDTERIMNGTLHKRLFNAYENMKTNGLTEESAKNYKMLYENESLMDILKESEFIFKEPIYGLDFYTSIMTEQVIPLHSFREEDNKLRSFMEEFGNMMSDDQNKKYRSSIEKIHSIMESRKNEICFSSFDESDEQKVLIESLCNDIYEGKEFTLESLSEENRILYAYYTLPSHNPGLLSTMLYNEMTMNESVETNVDSYHSHVRANVISSYLLEDTAIVQDIGKIPNMNLQLLMIESKSTNYRSVVDELFTEHVNDYNAMYTTPENAVMRMFHDDNYFESMQDEFLNIRLEKSYKTKEILEAVLDIVYNEYTHLNDDSVITSCSIVKDLSGKELTVKESVDYLIEKVNAFESIVDIALEKEEDESFFEYTRRGEATPVIRKSAGNLREEPFSGGEKKKSKNDSSDDYDDEDDEDDEEEDEVPLKKKPIKKEKQVKDIESDDDLDDKDDDIDSNKKGKPVKQKQSITRKIQNKAIDMDVKMQKGEAKAKENATNLKNAAKAVLRLPMNIVNALKTGIEEWRTMSDEKRKEKIIQPGYRTKIFKQLRTAITYGAIWHWKKYMVIVTFICKHTILHPFYKMNKDRTLRLRNELTAELETEIAVTEEKINDANANGDQRQKYELIRIKKKLEAEKVRVATNSKYI